MPFVTIDKPTQDVLDNLMLERMRTIDRPCHDCGVKPGQPHTPGCDTARCLKCGGQRLSCHCGEEGDGDIWTGLWPGIVECYEYGLVCRWEGKITYEWEKDPRFDLNRQALYRQIGYPHDKVCSFQNFKDTHKNLFLDLSLVS